MHTDVYKYLWKPDGIKTSFCFSATYLKTQALHSNIIMSKLAGAWCFCYAGIKIKLQGMARRKPWNCSIPAQVLLFLLCPAPRCFREVAVPRAAVPKPSTRQGPTLHKVCSWLWCGNVARSHRSKIWRGTVLFPRNEWRKPLRASIPWKEDAAARKASKRASTSR